MEATRSGIPKEPDISRRRLITGVSAAGGLLLSSALPGPVFAHDDEDDNQTCRADGLCESPDPIPHVNKVLTAGFGVKAHFFFAGPVEGTAAPTDPEGPEAGGRDPSLIYDFKGFIGQADLNLTGTGTDLNTGMSQKYSFHTDSRFMTGVFVGNDGRQHRGSFAFV